MEANRISRNELEKLVEIVNHIVRAIDKRFECSIHLAPDLIQVYNKESGEIVGEIAAHEVPDLVSKLYDNLRVEGMFIDKKI